MQRSLPGAHPDHLSRCRLHLCSYVPSRSRSRPSQTRNRWALRLQHRRFLPHVSISIQHYFLHRQLHVTRIHLSFSFHCSVSTHKRQSPSLPFSRTMRNLLSTIDWNGTASSQYANNDENSTTTIGMGYLLNWLDKDELSFQSGRFSFYTS